MPQNSARLAMPYIQPSQAQKHVTHNEALKVLDVLVQASVVSKDQTAPPAAPADGACYVVAGGATGAWVGHDTELAVWDDTGWTYHVPSEGWTVWVDDLDALWSFDGAAWIPSAAAGTLQNLPSVGVNATADATNRLTVSAPSTLLTSEGAGHQLVINKTAAPDTASLLFQSNWTGHAEMGLAGNTDFSIKTSDGVGWFNALNCASATGRVSFPAGLSGRIEVFDTGNSVILGEGAGANDTLSGTFNVYAGYLAGSQGTTGANNVAIGADALRENTTGTGNAAIGSGALRYTTTGTPNTAFSNCTGVGEDTRVSGSNQVQLGNSTTTTYAFGAVQDRSDARDKADVRDTTLGLDFIARLRPVDFRWDMRDDYLGPDTAGKAKPGQGGAGLAAVAKDGSRKRKRYHHGLIAQEVAAVLKETGLDFGGYQNHGLSPDGEDVLTIGYTELIGPLIRAVQELSQEVAALKKTRSTRAKKTTRATKS